MNYWKIFLLRSNEVSIHQKQLRQLTTEICKTLTDLSPEFIKPFFTVKELPYNYLKSTIGTNYLLWYQFNIFQYCVKFKFGIIYHFP